MSYTVKQQLRELGKARGYGDGIAILVKQNVTVQELLKEMLKAMKKRPAAPAITHITLATKKDEATEYIEQKFTGILSRGKWEPADVMDVLESIGF